MIPDSLFGALHSSPGPEHGTFHWMGQGTFPPTGESVDYQFDAPKNGPTEGHRDLLQRIHHRYLAELLPKVLPLLNAYQAGETGGPTGGRATRPLRLVALWVPPRDEVTMEWDLTFEAPDTHERYMVDMRGWAPIGVEPE